MNRSIHTPAMLKSTAILGLAILVQMAFAAPLMAKDRADMSQKINALLATWSHTDTPGAAVIVVEDGKVIHRKGYGMANLEYGVPITPETPFHVASVSKQFTAFAVARLAEEGKIAIDAPIQTYLPEVPRFAAPITPYQMIHHTSGLRDQWALLMLQGHTLSDVITDAHIIELVKQQRDLNFEPGSRFIYSNTGYTLLAQLVARVSGKSFRAWTHDEIFAPLDMARSHFHDDYTEIVPGRAYSYQPTPPGGAAKYSLIPLNYGTVGATGLFTTADDLAKWMDNLISGRLGGTALRDLMMAPGRLNGGGTIEYGYGLSPGTYRNEPVVGHAGSDAGFRSDMLVFPNRKLGIAVLANSADVPVGVLTRQIADIIIGEADAATALATTAGTDTVVVPEPYIGRYLMEDGSFLTVTPREHGINLQVGPTTLKLYPISSDSFVIREADAGVRFSGLRDGTYRNAELRNLKTHTSGERVDIMPIGAERLAEYAGRYLVPEVGSVIEVNRGGEALVLRVAGLDRISLSYAGGDLFIAPDAGAILRFERGTGRAITGARVTSDRIHAIALRKLPPE